MPITVNKHRSIALLAAIFSGSGIAYAQTEPITIVTAPAPLAWDALEKKADELEGRFGLEFCDFVSRMKDVNLHSNNRLLL